MTLNAQTIGGDQAGMIFFKSFCPVAGQVLHALNGACPCGTPARRIRFDGWIVKVIQDAETVAFRTVGPNSRRRFNVGPRNAAASEIPRIVGSLVRAQRI